MVRTIPEARIKQLSVVKKFDSPRDDIFLREQMIAEAGMELAKKLFEFNKVLVTRSNNTFTMTIKIEIIVPEGIPDALPSQTPIQ